MSKLEKMADKTRNKEITVEKANEFISAVDLKHEYENPEEGAHLVLKGLNLNIDKGSFVAVLGHNGSGKSTLAKHFNAMLLPTGGALYVKGMDTSDEDLKYDIRQSVGMVFQNPDNQIVATIIEEDVAFGCENLGVPRDEIRKRVDEALKTVGMYEYRTHASYKLSGGQKQRIAIAGIIAMKPECIVLDEATAMLDPRGRKEVLETVHKLNKELGITIIMITHYMDEAVDCDRVVVLDEGEIVADGTPRQVFSQVEKLKSIELDVPQPTRLAHKIRKAGYKIDESVMTVDECANSIAKLLGDASQYKM